MRAADIIVEQQCGSLTYKITLRVYMNTGSGTPFGGASADDGHIDFGDGSPLHLIPETAYTVRPDLGLQIGVVTYSVEHTYIRPGEYKINYFERDRSGGVVNIPNSHDVAYSTYVIINAQADFCNRFPELLVPPVDQACRGVAFFHTPGATDADGDSLSYELTVPARSAQLDVSGYVAPDNRVFYSNYETGNEAGTGPPSFLIDSETGLITWDAPGISGEYNIAFKIIEWRRDNATGQYTRLSTTVRDMQIIVLDCNNTRPSLEIPANICVQAGELVTGTFTGTDPERNRVKIEVISSIFDLAPDKFPATYEPRAGEYQNSDPPLRITFRWQTHCIHARDQNYQVVVKITDEPATGPPIVTFKTWNIRVIAPPPIWRNTSVDLIQRTASLRWENYSCHNATQIQVWRKVGSTPFTPGRCTPGLSANKGYVKIADLHGRETQFIDDNQGKRLSAGARYCYRLVAVLDGGTGRSYVSSEACVDPILADAPVITNASILKTENENGEVEVRWIKPFDISTQQFPEPYQYEVYRSDGFFPEHVPVNVSGRLSDVTAFTDVQANSQDSAYNYQIVLFSKAKDKEEYYPIDTSAVASTVRLVLTPGEKQISLKWNAEVPWSNVTAQRPYHRIYRGVFGESESDLVLIDSMDVSEFGFEYTDIGKYQNIPLQDDVHYCYVVETIGTYGNSRIPLLFNRSQMACSYPINNLPLCMPSLTVDKTDCEEYLSLENCDQKAFQNELSWTYPEPAGCRQDYMAVKIYTSSTPEGEFQELITIPVTENYYNDEVLSMARCYKMSAVDSRGNESELTPAFCNDNCPYYNLPNVFTPNGDGCNDLFSAYIADQQIPLSICEYSEDLKCPRFVKSVRFKVMNRWGRILYEYSSDDQNSININWDGRDHNGTLLDAGTYYYVADVEFDVSELSQQSTTLRGSFRIIL